jgi:RimJ/RimL family protein N-acetyltransferase
MHPDIASIFATFTKQDLRFLDESCVFMDPIYREIVYQDDNPVCFIEAEPYANDVYLNIGVVPLARRTGVARKAFLKLLNWFVTTSYTGILWNAHISNTASIRLAQTLGFTEFQSPDRNIRYFALGNRET